MWHQSNKKHFFYRFQLVIPEKLTRYLMPFLIAKDPQLSGCYISMLEMKWGILFVLFHRAFSHDVTPAMLVFQSISLGVKLFFLRKRFLSFQFNLHRCWPREWKRSIACFLTSKPSLVPKRSQLGQSWTLPSAATSPRETHPPFPRLNAEREHLRTRL